MSEARCLETWDSWKATLPSSEAHASSHMLRKQLDEQELGRGLGAAVPMQRKGQKLSHSSSWVHLHQISRGLPDVALLPKYPMLCPILKPPVDGPMQPEQLRVLKTQFLSGYPWLHSVFRTQSCFFLLLEQNKQYPLCPQRFDIFLSKTFVLLFCMCLCVCAVSVGARRGCWIL